MNTRPDDPVGRASGVSNDEVGISAKLHMPGGIGRGTSHKVRFDREEVYKSVWR